MSREEWLEARRKVVTATDIAAILGVHPYKSAHQVYLDKHGLLPEIDDNEPMWWGRELESKIGDWFTQQTGNQLIKAEFAVDPDEAIFGCTPDYYIEPGGILECKVAGEGAARNFGASETDEVPDHYLCQVMWQMAVTRRKEGRLAVLLPSLRMRTYTFAWDEQLIQHMRFQARKFWHEYVKAELAPPLSGTRSDSEYINDKFKIAEPGKMIVAGYDQDEIAKELAVAIAANNTAEQEVERLKNELKSFMGDAETLETTSGKFSWKAPSGYPKYKEVLADIVSHYEVDAEILASAKARHMTASERRFLTPFRSNKA